MKKSRRRDDILLAGPGIPSGTLFLQFGGRASTKLTLRWLYTSRKLVKTSPTTHRNKTSTVQKATPKMCWLHCRV